MRLWHESIITKLPRQQLLGQHRECCALRGNGWGKKHATVDYVFTYSPYKLYQYHMLVINEMKRRGYNIDQMWENPSYRGKKCPPFENMTDHQETYSPYEEHDNDYLKECIDNLAKKGIQITV